MCANVTADAHRDRVWQVYFPQVRGKHQRKNRLKYWILRKLPNGNLRNTSKFEHYCSGNCCKYQKDFLRKLKWVVAIIAGRMCVLFPRSRWAKLDEALDWVGVLTEIHGLLQTSYRLWYKKVTGRNPPPMSAGGAGGVGAFDHAALVDADVNHDLPDLGPDPAGAEADPVDAAAEDERAAAVGDAASEKAPLKSRKTVMLVSSLHRFQTSVMFVRR